MKKYFWLASIAVLLVTAQHGSALTGALTASYEILDSELTPGQETIIFLTFKTTTAAPVRGISYTVSPGSYLGSDTNSANMGALGGGSSTQQTSFKIKAGDNAITTVSYVTVKTKYSDDEGDKETNLNIPVTIRRNPLIQIASVKYSKGAVEPGVAVDLVLNITNRGQGPAKEVTLTLNDSSSVFAIAGTSKQLYLDNVGTGEYKIARYPLVISPNAAIGTYNIPVTVSYKDETKTKSYSSSETIGMVVAGGGGVMLIKNSQDVLSPGKAGELTVETVNTGKQAMRFLILDIRGTENIAVEPSKIYIGKLDSDDSDTSRIKIIPATTVQPGVYSIDVAISYSDMFSASYNDMTQIDVVVSEAAQPGFSTVQIIIVVVAVAVIAKFALGGLKKARK